MFSETLSAKHFRSHDESLLVFPSPLNPSSFFNRIKKVTKKISASEPNVERVRGNRNFGDLLVVIGDERVDEMRFGSNLVRSPKVDYFTK